MDVSPDGRRLCLGTTEGTLQLYDVKTVSRFGDTNKSTIGQRVNQAMEDARSLPYRFSV